MPILSHLRRCFSSKPTNRNWKMVAPPRSLPIKQHDGGGGDGGDGRKVQDFAACRIREEMKALSVNPPTHCSFGPISDDIFEWEGIIIGPANTCYESGLFHLSIHFPHIYPFKPPIIKFLTKIYHPNIEENGRINIDILEENSSPALTIEKLMVSICSILGDPMAEHSINEASMMYKNDFLTYYKTAKEWTKKYAMGN